MYRVINPFYDLELQRNFSIGDEYPGTEVSEARLADLKTDRNRQHKPLIAEESQETPAMPTKSPKKADAVAGKEKPSPRKKAVK